MEGTILTDYDVVGKACGAISIDSPGKVPSGTQDSVSMILLSSPGMNTISISYWDISSCHLNWWQERLRHAMSVGHLWVFMSQLVGILTGFTPMALSYA
jgi:hypothetical protein